MRSGVAIAVPAGSPRTDIGSAEALKAAVPGAATKGHPAGPSGTHLPRVFECWGILAKIRERIVQALAGVAVARLIAKGNVALSVIRRAPQLGQKPRRLQLNATNFSSWQDSQRTLRKPCSSLPHFKYSSNSFVT